MHLSWAHRVPWPFLLLSCRPVNAAIKKDKYEMLGILTCTTCWDLKMYRPLAEIYKPLHGCCWLLQRHTSATHHVDLWTLVTCRVAIWDIALRFERTWPRCDLRPKRVVKWTTSLETTTFGSRTKYINAQTNKERLLWTSVTRHSFSAAPNDSTTAS